MIARRRIRPALALLAAMLLVLVQPAPAAEVRIPSAAERLRPALQVEARRAFGLDAPVARFAAQIHQESAWRADARSPFADGLAQFTPATAEWIAEAYPDACAPANPFSERWAIRCLVRYDRHLWERVRPWAAPSLAVCDRWAFTLSGYNGGPGWVNRDRKLAQAAGRDPDRWFGHVEHHSSRAAWAFRENRGYPERILRRLEPAYVAAGWLSGEGCAP